MRVSAIRQVGSYEVFSRATKIAQRTRAARDVEQSRTVDYLRQEVARRMVERLSFVQRDIGPMIDLGAGAGWLEKAICDQSDPDAGIVRGRLKGPVSMVEGSRELLYRDSEQAWNEQIPVRRIVADEETWTTEEGSVDAVLSNMALHWINDLPGVISRATSWLRPDGLFLASMLAGDSMYELRTSLQLAEQERYGGVSPRLSPLANPSDLGGLMQRAGLQLVTLDVDEIVVGYPDMFALLDDLKAMGESNAVATRPATISPSLLLAANAIYNEMHRDPEMQSGVSATFRIMYMIGWKYSSTQPKPLARGSVPRGFTERPKEK